MAETLNRKDGALLTALGEYRILTTSQIAGLSGVGNPAVRRRLRKLRQLGLVRSMTRLLEARSGRPEELKSLTAEGVARLEKEGRIAKSTPASDVTGEGVRRHKGDSILTARACENLGDERTAVWSALQPSLRRSKTTSNISVSSRTSDTSRSGTASSTASECCSSRTPPKD